MGTQSEIKMSTQTVIYTEFVIGGEFDYTGEFIIEGWLDTGGGTDG